MVALTGFSGIATYVGLDALKSRDLRRAEATAQDLALAASLTVAKSIDKIDISLRVVTDALERARPELPELHELLARQYRLVTEAGGISVTDASGRVIAHEGEKRPSALSVDDRAYFSSLAHGERSGLTIGGPLTSRISGNHVLVFARAYANAEGGFGGVVAIPAPTARFRQMISGYEIEPRDSLGLWTSALEPIARFPDRDATLPSPEASAAMASQRIAATFHDTGPDGPRIVAIERIGDAPIYAMATIGKTDALAAWRNLRTAALAILAAFVGGITLAAWRLHRIWEKQRRHALELAESNARLAKADREIRVLDMALMAARDVGKFGTFSVDFTAGTWIASPEQAAIFGIDGPGTRPRSAWHDLFHPGDYETFRTEFEELLRQGAAEFDAEYRIVRPSDGEVRWIHSIGRIKTGETGPLLIGAVKDVTDEKLRRDRAEYLALHDPLTHLPNRALLADRMRQALADRHGDLLAVCYLDLDGFKRINDTWGHDLGDALLVEAARRLQRQARAGDTVARLGGDEFVVLLCGIADAAELEDVARRILDAVARPYRVGGIDTPLSASVGISIRPRDPAIEPDALIREADQAMYAAKREGRNRFHIYDPEQDLQLRKLRAHAARVAEALENGEFRLHYQPRVDLRSGAVDGVEALLRWQHPERGLLPPAAFLAGIEGSDLAAPLGDWVLRTALRQQRDWLAAGLELTVAVNVFGDQLQHPDFAARLAEILAEFPGHPPSGLELEILETTAMRDLCLVAERLSECVRLGVEFALDDFGTGYSSLTYFRSLPVSTLKIDRSFVADILVSRNDLALVRSVIALAHAFDRTVVAEGVETLAHGRPLQDYGCNLAQGFGIARPMPAEEILPWAKAWRMPAEWSALYD